MVAPDIEVPPEPVVSTAGNVSEEQKAQITKCEDWFNKSKRFMEPQRNRWRLNEKLYQNDVEVPGPVKATKLKFNLALAVVETEMPILSDYLPTFDVEPDGRDDVFFADMMQKRKSQIERQSKLKKKSLDVIKDSLIYSNGISQILPTLNEGSQLIGIDIKSVDPFTWFPDPNATGFEIGKNAKFHIFATPMYVDDIREKYDVTVEAEGFIDEYSVFQFVDKENKSEKAAGADMALLKECYANDPDKETYPNGRVTLWANNIFISDTPLWEDYKSNEDGYKPGIPYFMIGNYRTAHSLFGIGEPELIRTQVKALNQVMSNLAEVINKTGNPIRKITHALWTKLKSKIMGIPGEEVIVDRPDDLTWDVPPSIPAYTFNFVDLLLKLTDVVTGIHDVMEGKKPTGITAASAIAALQEAAQARVRYKITNEITEYIEDVGKYIIWLLQTYDNEVISIRNQNKAGEYDFTDYDPKGSYDAAGLQENDDKFNKETAKTMKDSNFDIEVVAGARLPSGRIPAEERAITLFEKGIYGIEAAVNALSEPDKQDLIEDYYKREGLKQIVERQEQLNEGFKEFEKLVDKALNETEEWQGSLEEEKMIDLLKQFPDFLNTREFEVLPEGVKERVMAVFV